MLIKSTHFGQIEMPDADLINFPKGVPGFAEAKLFAFIPYGSDSPFAFLQSASEPDLVFTIVESFSFFTDYQFEIDDQLTQDLGLSSDNPPQIFNIVTVPENAEEMTANLLAPIVINIKTRQAMQIVLEKSAYHTRHRLFPQGWNKQDPKGRS